MALHDGGQSRFGFQVSDRTKMTSPAFGRAVLPTSRVGSYINQQLAGVQQGTAARPAQRDPGQIREQLTQPAAGPGVAVSPVAQSSNRVLTDIAESNARMRRSYQIAAAKRQRQQPQSTNTPDVHAGHGQAAPQPGGVRGGGPAASRIQQLVPKFPGLRITEIGGNRAYDVKHGVARVPTSYHYDTKNPAVDIAGPTAQLDALYRELVRQGGWRQILWRVPGHYDHIHVA